MGTNNKAHYYTPYGSYDGAIKIGGRWVRAKELNRIDKSGWKRWQGPPSAAICNAIKTGHPVQATELLPERRIKHDS